MTEKKFRGCFISVQKSKNLDLFCEQFPSLAEIL
jgi:hypothetical protein